MDAVIEAAKSLGAMPADIPGLWLVPGYPELTTGQMLQVAKQSQRSVTVYSVAEALMRKQ